MKINYHASIQLLIIMLWMFFSVQTQARSESCAVFGRKLVCQGDNYDSVKLKAGKPQQKSRTYNRSYGANVRRWAYSVKSRPPKIVLIDFKDGVVVYITERR